MLLYRQCLLKKFPTPGDYKALVNDVKNSLPKELADKKDPKAFYDELKDVLTVDDMK